MISMKGYSAKPLHPPLSEADTEKILEARNFLLEFFICKIKNSNGVLDYKIDYSIERTTTGISTKHSRVTFEGTARMIQEQGIRLVEKRVDNPLRFTELLMRCVLYEPTHRLELTIYDEEELEKYLETFALQKCSIEKIYYKLEIPFQ